MTPTIRPKDCVRIKDISQEHDPRVWLMAKLGSKDFKTFQEKFGGKKIWIPKVGCQMPCAFCDMRKKHIQLYRNKGKTVAWLATRFKLSEKQIYSQLK